MNDGIFIMKLRDDDIIEEGRGGDEGKVGSQKYRPHKQIFNPNHTKL